MKKLHEALITCLLLALPILPVEAAQQAIVSMPTVGKVSVTAHTAAKKDSAVFNFLTFKNTSGRFLKRLDFGLTGLPGLPPVLRFGVLHPKKDGPPLIVAVDSWPGGSTIHYETTIIGTINGALVELIPAHIESSTLDALCFDTSDRRPELDLLFFNFLFEEARYAPHRYMVTVYRWTDAGFTEAGKNETTNKYTDWTGAAAELGYACRTDLVTTINGVYR
jgi:hypothetical protein